MPPEWDDREGLATWFEPNPWVQIVFGDAFSCWILGHAQHCSCGCIDSRGINGRVELKALAAKYICHIAETMNLAFAIHWTTGSYAEEELPFEITTSITQAELRRSINTARFKTDEFVWVQGPTGNSSL